MSAAVPLKKKQSYNKVTFKKMYEKLTRDNLRILEKLSSFTKFPIDWNFLLIHILNNFFNAFMLNNKLDGIFRSDSRDFFTIVTAQQNTKINELVVTDIENFLKFFQAELCDWHFTVHIKSEMP